MRPLFHLRSIAVFIAISCVSCGDDPMLVAKSEKQRAEISRLKGEIALIEEKLKNMPPDVSEELEATRKKTEEQTAEIANLEKEINALNARKRSLQDDYDTYRLKYRLK